ncbi:MAG: PIN domain-containing protein [Ruminococcus flavefaciens]|nr:PIN domain-containing protein [Eubacterium sp.]MCM1235807.1 PIN domain-containing protein [Ruminococcus flavefaciens]
MIIYLDNCCYNRPFDDRTQERIHLESEVILSVLKMGQMKKVSIVGSDILDLEMSRMQDENKRQKVLNLYRVVGKHIQYTEKIKQRSADIMSVSKIRALDSLHIASAEEAKADIFLTTDDKLEKMAEKLMLGTKVINPLRFAWEVI